MQTTWISSKKNSWAHSKICMEKKHKKNRTWRHIVCSSPTVCVCVNYLKEFYRVCESLTFASSIPSVCGRFNWCVSVSCRGRGEACMVYDCTFFQFFSSFCSLLLSISLKNESVFYSSGWADEQYSIVKVQLCEWMVWRNEDMQSIYDHQPS